MPTRTETVTAFDVPDVQTLIDRLLPHRSRQGSATLPDAELAARVQVIAAISTNEPDRIDSGLRAIDPAFVQPTVWGKWAIWANARVTLDVLSERWGLTPFDEEDRAPLFAWAFQAAAAPSTRDWCMAHGVTWNQRWDGLNVVDVSFPQGPVGMLSGLLWNQAWSLALQGLDRPEVQQDQDQLDRGLYTLMARLAGKKPTTAAPLAILQRLLELGANPARAFEQRPQPFPVMEHPTAAHWAVASLRDVGEAPHQAGSTLTNVESITKTTNDENQGAAVLGRCWTLFADWVDWSTLPGRSPLIDALDLPHTGLKSETSRKSSPDQDLAWHGQWLVQDLLHRGAAMVSSSSDQPLVWAWKRGATEDRWDPFWALCRHHRAIASPERLPSAITIDLMQQWAGLWGEKLTADWHHQDSSVRQARVMEQTARLRALVQWAPEQDQAWLHEFSQQAHEEMRELVRPLDSLQEEEAQRDQARLLADTWTLRAESCRVGAAEPPPPRRRL